MKSIHYWLLKTEPETYSFQQLVQNKKTHWDGVRNFQARNFLKEMKTKDLALIYHSGKEKAVVGLAEVIQEAYPEKDPTWIQVDLKSVKTLPSAVTLAQLKMHPELQELRLIKQSRLSVMPITESEFKTILNLGKLHEY